MTRSPFLALAALLAASPAQAQGWWFRAQAASAAPIAVWDFTTGSLPSGVTASGGTNGTVTNAAGNIVAGSAPRFTYASGSVAGLLVETPDINTLYQSATLATSPWTASGASVAAPAVANAAAISPDGTSDASGLTFPAWTGAGNSSASSEIGQGTSVTGTWDANLYLKGAAGGETVEIFAQSTASPSTVLGHVYATLTTSWQRFGFPFTGSGAMKFIIGHNGALSDDAATVSTQTVYAWNAEVDFPTGSTPIVPTTSTVPVSRSSDVVTGTIPAGTNHITINFADGTSYADPAVPSAGISWQIPAENGKVIANVTFGP